MMKKLVLFFVLLCILFSVSAFANTQPTNLPHPLPYTYGGYTFDIAVIFTMNFPASCGNYTQAIYEISSELLDDRVNSNGVIRVGNNVGLIFGDTGNHIMRFKTKDVGTDVCGWDLVPVSNPAVQTLTTGPFRLDYIYPVRSEALRYSSIPLRAVNYNIQYWPLPYTFYGATASWGTFHLGDLIYNSTLMRQLSVTVEPEAGGTVEVNGVACSSCPCLFSINNQNWATLEAFPTCGYEFVRWEWNNGVSTSIDNPMPITLTEDESVEAVFYLKADDFIFPVLANGVTNPLLNTTNPDGNGWHGPGVGQYSASDGHLGQDYVMDANNGDGNASGEPVHAIANGTIVEVMNNQSTAYGWCDNDDHGWGPVVVIRHENKDGFDTTDSVVTTSCNTETNPTVIYSLYGHLSKTSIATLQVGQTIAKGQQIGAIGTFNVDQNSWQTNHLHFELKDEAGFNEKAWYFYQANHGVCPGTETQDCEAEGVGVAYSHSSGFAPHRYLPGIFIPIN